MKVGEAFEEQAKLVLKFCKIIYFLGEDHYLRAAVTFRLPSYFASWKIKLNQESYETFSELILTKGVRMLQLSCKLTQEYLWRNSTIVFVIRNTTSVKPTKARNTCSTHLIFKDALKNNNNKNLCRS